VGKRADIVLVNPRHWDVQPVYDPVFTVARGITGRDVESVIVDGQLVIQDQSFTTIDEDALRAELARRWPGIMQRFETITA
jgi:5-methylthioadenosine/S-adenosylhomocysteine deaminase